MYNVVLFIHLLTVAAAFFAMGIMLNSIIQLRSIHRIGEAQRCAGIVGNASKIMPLATLLLLLTGGYMTHDRWAWSMAWVALSVIGLLLVTFVGAGIMGPRERALHKVLSQASSEVLDDAVVSQLRAPLFLTGSGFNVGLVCAVMFVMVTKPEWLGGIVALIIGGVAGVAVFGLAARPRMNAAVLKAEAK